MNLKNYVVPAVTMFTDDCDPKHYKKVPYILDWSDASLTKQLHLYGTIGVSNLDLTRTIWVSIGDDFNGTKPTSLWELEYWDVSNIQKLGGILGFGRYIDTYPAFNNWNVSNATDLEYMFAYCDFPEGLYGLDHWDVTNVINRDNILFSANCLNFQQVKRIIRNWDTPKVKK